MNKHYPPVFKQTHFHCPHCEVNAKQDFHHLPMSFSSSSFSDVWRSRCQHCKRDCYWHDNETIHGRLLFPAAYDTPAPNKHMPEEIKADYIEAASIVGKSPRGAAALLRLVVQKLMIHLGMTGDNINNDIKTLVVAGLPAMVQQALDYCRIVGNNAVHPGAINLDDTPEMASTMFEMINVIVQSQIGAPKELDQIYGELPQAARDAISRRDAT